jgi:hypothetical protein
LAPAGLSFAASLCDTHLRIVLIYKLDELTLADPPYDFARFLSQMLLLGPFRR